MRLVDCYIDGRAIALSEHFSSLPSCLPNRWLSAGDSEHSNAMGGRWKMVAIILAALLVALATFTFLVVQGVLDLGLSMF